jgi:DNA-binding MarR family transcriptional regulator
VPDELPLLIADVFEAAGAMRRQGDRLAGVAGQTQARWQLLSVVTEGEWTVPQAARRLGITRQGVQRVADALAADGLITLGENPDHQRSPLLHLTDHGRDALATITHHARRWHRQLAPSLTPADLATARRVLGALIASSDQANADRGD